jgi:hypothetical protein
VEMMASRHSNIIETDSNFHSINISQLADNQLLSCDSEENILLAFKE